MRRRAATFALTLALAAVSWASTTTSKSALSQTPSADELRALVERLVANQHGNDLALAEYERRERRITRKDGDDERIADDKTYRVVPTGTGTLKLTLEERGQPIKPEDYRKQLRELERALLDALNPSLPRQKRAIEKWETRTRDRREMIGAIPEAFRVTWLGRESRNGRMLAKLRLDPNPDFKPRSRNMHLMTHVRAVLWVEEKQAQVVRIEAEIAEDIPVGGGVLGKVYKGGRFVLEQVEVAEGVWLPSLYDFNFDGRKFIFPFAVKEITEVRDYRRIGPPKEALAAVRREIQNGGAANGKAAPANGSR